MIFQSLALSTAVVRPQENNRKNQEISVGAVSKRAAGVATFSSHLVERYYVQQMASRHSSAAAQTRASVDWVVDAAFGTLFLGYE